MDPRTRIPALALLGLSCTDCSERSPGDADPIVGEWRAMDVDGDAFPMVADDERRGWSLEITDDHRGKFAYYYEEDDFDSSGTERTEYYSDLMVAADDAPNYRITVTGDFSDLIGGDGDYSSPGTSATASAGDDDMGSDTAGGYATTGALDPDEYSFDEFELQLRDALRPTRAGTMILDCELAAEVLTCERKPDGDGDDVLRTWRFERQPG